ncbi:Non-heme 11 kDa protein of cytochrome bc1 complex [Gonapodya prolifera JEL478]|uniref:Cytochrome b-c1 complex subunit 6 n=1 Tax=Gonapodya prolifera (strain JEL478) TaxID=1344416 RepID=A0A139A6W8_GONPJ|nr:Non-heme 11 kDa protein of cytochrome bc1 complex [Gonapodya prolifera JEL478]|eukprot:KXS12083.1 Non-heme 11 kDa protein of cytochrome bc1 complex [Gonapodya prolifera JEL478]
MSDVNAPNTEPEEVPDPLPVLREECEHHCTAFKAVYDACAERIEKEGGEQNCALEFFDLLECIDHCAAPKLAKHFV